MELSKGNIWHNAAREYVLFPNNYIIHKVTRAGGTTGTVGECINQHKKVLFVGPTNAICKDVIQSAIKYSNRKDAHVVHAEPNSQCSQFLKLVEKHPTIKKSISTVPISSTDCIHVEENNELVYCEDYDTCMVTEILRTPPKDIDAITITHQKLATMQMSYENYQENLRKSSSNKKKIPPMSVQIYQKIVQFTEVVVYDECHYLEKPVETKVKATTILGIGTSTPYYSFYNTHEIIDLLASMGINVPGNELDFPIIADILNHFHRLVSNPKIMESIKTISEKASQDDYWKHHLCETIKNPDKFIFTDEMGNPYENQAAGIVGFFQEIIGLAILIDEKDRRDDRGYRCDYSGKIKEIQKLINIVISDIMKIPAIRDGTEIKVDIAVNSTLNNEMVSHFISNIQDGTKSIIFTSATISEHDYSQYFKDGHINSFFGGNGDPMYTNANMLVLCDHKKLGNGGGDYGFWGNIPKIVNTIMRVIQTYGEEDVLIITKSKMCAEAIEGALRKKKCYNSVFWYGGVETVGVAHDARVVVLIGMAEKPSNYCDAMYDDNVVSKNMRRGIVHADTLQAMARVKDPLGINPSIAIFIGVTEAEIIQMVTWGSNRRVTIDMDENIHVICDEYMTRPQIQKYKDDNDMISLASKFKKPMYTETYVPCKQNDVVDLYKGSHKPISVDDFYIPTKYVVAVIDPIFPLILNSGKNECITATTYLHSNNIIGRGDMYSVYDEDGSFDIIREPLTNEILQSHIDGKQTIGVCMLRPDNTVSCMFFDIHGSILQDKRALAQMNKNTICNYLDSLDFEGSCYVLEALGNYSFRIWINFKVPQNARDIKNFGKGILKELKIEEGVEVYPKTCMIKKGNKGDLVPLPRIVSVDPIISVGNYTPEATALN